MRRIKRSAFRLDRPAKVGVVGSNPIARSKVCHDIKNFDSTRTS